MPSIVVNLDLSCEEVGSGEACEVLLIGGGIKSNCFCHSLLDAV